MELETNCISENSHQESHFIVLISHNIIVLCVLNPFSLKIKKILKAKINVKVILKCNK